MKKQGPALPYRLIMKQFAIQSFLFVLLAGAVLSFQNCGGPIVSEADLASQAANLPLAFEAQMDQVAYMSCSSINNPTSHFNYKVGAYASPSGLRFRSAFRSAASQFKSESDLLDALQASSINTSSKSQLAIRQVVNLQSSLNSSVSTFPSSLVDASISGYLRSTGGTGYISYFPNQPSGYQNIEMQIAYPTTTENDASLNRANVLSSGGAGVLATTFSSGGGTAIATPGTAVTTAYGRGFTFTFGIPSGYSGGMPTKVLTSVSERNLETNSNTGSSWDCNSNYVFKIVRAQDRNGGAGQTCSNANFDDVTGGPTQALVYNTIRSMLPQTYWAVDVVNRCIVAKTTATNGTCYPASTAVGAINYGGGTCVPGSNTCPHFLSVCKRL